MIWHLLQLQTDGIPWTLRSRNRIKILLTFDLILIWLPEGVIRGHCMFLRIAERMGYSANDLRRSCLDKEEKES